MAYALDLTIPVSTAEASPASGSIYMAACVVSRIELTFPDGCAGLVGVRFKYYTRQLWPCNPEEWFRGNGQAITFEPKARFEESPAVLYVEGYNSDDTFAHTVYVVVGVDFEGDYMDKLIAAVLQQNTSGLLPGR